MTRRDIFGLPLLQVVPGDTLPPVYRWQGSAREIGKQHGSALSGEIRREFASALRDYAQASGQSEIESARQVWRTYRGEFAQRVPSAIEEIEGISEGSGLPLEVAFFAATRDLLPIRHGCTAIICGGNRSSSGMPMIGQTKDTAAPLDRFKLMVLGYGSGLRAVALGYPGWIGNMSLSSHGLAWTGNSLYAAEPSGTVHPASLLKRIFLESATVAEALERSKGLRFGNSCFGIADRSGRAVFLEWVGGECDLIEVRDGLFGHANGILGRFRNRDRSSVESPGSASRQRRIDSLLSGMNGKVTVGHLETCFRDHHDSPYSICSHTSSQGIFPTTAGYIADLAKLEFHVVVGPPCLGKFRTFRMEA